MASAARSAAAAAAGPGAPAASSSARQTFKDLRQLSKGNLTLLVASTASAGFVAGSGEEVDWAAMGWLTLGTIGASACANTVNQIMERSHDALMKRTRGRPLPAGRMGVPGVAAFALATGLGGVALLAWKNNALTAALGAGNIALYTMVYTPMKRISVANTWVGALVGAIPPLMGWAAASGSLDPGAFVLAAALQFWQLPHFMSLAWLCRADYAAGGYRMLPIVDASGARTAAVALRNSLYLFPVGFLAERWDVASREFTLQAAALSTVLACSALVFYMKPSTDTARTLFRASLVHLPLYMGSLLYHRIPQGEGAAAKVRREQEEGVGGVRRAELLAVPFPFLPVPAAAPVPNRGPESNASGTRES